MPKLEIHASVRPVDGCQVVTLEGAIDTANTDQLRTIIDPLCEGESPRVIVDCENLTYVNSSSFGLLFHYHRRCEAQNGQFALCRVQEKILSIIQILGLHNVLRVYSTLDEALAALSAV